MNLLAKSSTAPQAFIAGVMLDGANHLRFSSFQSIRKNLIDRSVMGELKR